MTDDADPEVDARIALLREARLRKVAGGAAGQSEHFAGKELDRILPDDRPAVQRMSFAQKKQRKAEEPTMIATARPEPKPAPAANGHAFAGAGGRTKPIIKDCPTCGKPCNKANGRCYACVPSLGPGPRNRPPESKATPEKEPPETPVNPFPRVSGSVTTGVADSPGPIPMEVEPAARILTPFLIPAPAPPVVAPSPVVDREVAAIAAVVAAMDGLDAPSMRRVLVYARARFGREDHP